MKNRKNMSGSYQKFIRTKHVFIEGDRLFYKKENHEKLIEEPVVQWFPVNFQRTTL